MNQEADRQPIKTQRGAPWLALGVGLVLMALTLWLWHVCRANAWRTIEEMLREQGTYLDEAILIGGSILALLFCLLLLYLSSIRKARGEAAAAERRYRSLVQATSQIVWTTDPSGRLSRDLPHWRVMTGQSREEILGHGWFKAVHPKDRRRMIETWLRAVANKCIYESEQRIRTREGEYRWFICRGVPVIENDATVREWIGTCDDIHDRRVAETALRESEERFHATFNQAAAGIVHGSLDGNILLANERFCELTGYRAEELNQKSIQELTHPEDWQEELRGFERLEAGEIPTLTLEKRYWHKDGSEVWVNLSASLIRDSEGTPLYVVGVVEDISARHRYERAVRESEERYRVLAETIPQMVWTNRPDGTFSFCNQHWCEYTGLTLEDSIKIGWTAVLHPEDMHRALAAWNTALRSGQRLTCELRMRRAADQALRWHFIHIVPARDGAGGIITWIGSAMDIHDRKLAEETLVEADRRKDEFLAMLAHELRNPLAPIRYALQLLRLAENNDSVLERQRDVIDRQVSYMARLLDDLLDVSRTTQGKITLRKEILDLRRVADQAIDAVRGLVHERQHELFYQRGPAPVWLAGDATRLEQILFNLLNNAIKYTETGGSLWVSVDTEPAQDEPAEARAVIRVRDTGVGISAAMLPRVFDLFMQADQSLDRSRGGLGIGLTLVRSLVELHGGVVEALSEGLGQGSEFIVRLPLGAPPEPAQAPAEAPLEGVGAGVEIGDEEFGALKVLVVDDNMDTALALAELVETWGYQAAVAFDGPLALQLSRELQPDVVLLDIGLPGVDGYEVARRLRGEVGLDSALLIALTGYGREEDRHQAIMAGFDYHFTKPIILDELKAILREIMNRLARGQERT